MKCPNLRYGNPEALRYYAMGSSVKELAKRLRRSERSVHDWMIGRKKVPYWVPELLRLQHMEHLEMMRQMNMPGVFQKLGLVMSTGTLYEFTSKDTQAMDNEGCDANALP